MHKGRSLSLSLVHFEVLLISVEWRTTYRVELFEEMTLWRKAGRINRHALLEESTSNVVGGTEEQKGASSAENDGIAEHGSTDSGGIDETRSAAPLGRPAQPQSVSWRYAVVYLFWGDLREDMLSDFRISPFFELHSLLSSSSCSLHSNDHRTSIRVTSSFSSSAVTLLRDAHVSLPVSYILKEMSSRNEFAVRVILHS